ncbi:MAG: 7-cyano-7-deazaguanine synthase [Methanomassiliicoccales archaeon]|nr:MAG: 7-cyano-7-deazaguanine synthase [Methanomassiliicoccales archaeon]
MKLISLISGGIDSPVATHMMLERKAEIVAVHFDNRPFTDEGQLNKTKSLIKELEKHHNREIKTIIVPHKESHIAFGKHCKRNLHCVLCRRMMFRIAEKIAQLEKADALLTGESLGQVASQTLRNIRTESQAVEIPILRPLIGLDKLEIEKFAKEIGTYEISILPGMCCTIVPKRPSTFSRLSVVLEEEKKVDIEGLVKKAMNGVIKI